MQIGALLYIVQCQGKLGETKQQRLYPLCKPRPLTPVLFRDWQNGSWERKGFFGIQSLRPSAKEWCSPSSLVLSSKSTTTVVSSTTKLASYIWLEWITHRGMLEYAITITITITITIIKLSSDVWLAGAGCMTADEGGLVEL